MRLSFSILKRIECGETVMILLMTIVILSFSILKRIECGETLAGQLQGRQLPFQYPQTDRMR